MNILEAAARKAIDTAVREDDRDWAAAWNARAISFVCARTETGEPVAVEVHDRRGCTCVGCRQFNVPSGVRQVVIITMR